MLYTGTTSAMKYNYYLCDIAVAELVEWCIPVYYCTYSGRELTVHYTAGGSCGIGAWWPASHIVACITDDELRTIITIKHGPCMKIDYSECSTALLLRMAEYEA